MIGGDATSRVVLLIFSILVYTSELDSRFVALNVNPLNVVQQELNKRRTGIPCVLFLTVALHRIVKGIRSQLRSIHHHLTLGKERILFGRRRSRYRLCTGYVHVAAPKLFYWQGNSSIQIRLFFFDFLEGDARVLRSWTSYSRVQES